MNPKIFIFNWFLKYQEKLPLKKVKYEYHDYSDTHFVYCEPSPDNLDTKFQELLTDFILQFYAEYKNTLVGLLDEKSLTKLENSETIIDKSFSKINTYYKQFELNISENYLQQLIFNEPAIPYMYSIHYEIFLPDDFSLNKYSLKNIDSGIITAPSIFFELVGPANENQSDEIIIDIEISSKAA